MKNPTLDRRPEPAQAELLPWTDGEAWRVLVRSGWRVKRQRGSHLILEHAAAGGSWSPAAARASTA